MSSFAGGLISEPTSFVITELVAPFNTLVLEGRALPYQGFRLSGKMRGEFTWYPGNPVATVQVLGAEEAPTAVNGMWKDRFMAAFDALGLPVISGRTAKATFNGLDVANVRDLSEIVDGFRLRGLLQEVGWDQFVRQGLMIRYDSNWIRREDVEWEMEWQWINRGEPVTPVAFGVRVPAIDILNQISAAIDDLKAALDAPFAFVSAIQNEATNALAAIEEAASAVADIANKAAKALLSPLEVARSTLSALNTVKDQAQEIADIFQSVPARAQRISADIVAEAQQLVGGDVSVQAGASGGVGGTAGGVVGAAAVQTGAVAAPETTSNSQTAGIDQLTQEQVLQAEATKRNVRFASRNLRSIATQRADEVAAQATVVPDVQSFVARDGMDLRDASTRFYGTPEEWKRLLTYNNLESSKLTAGQILLVPPLNTPLESLGQSALNRPRC